MRCLVWLSGLAVCLTGPALAQQELVSPSSLLLHVVRSPIFVREMSRYAIADVTEVSIVREQGVGKDAIYRVTVVIVQPTGRDVDPIRTPVTAYARWIPRGDFGPYIPDIWIADPVVQDAVAPAPLAPGVGAQPTPAAPAPAVVPPSVSRPLPPLP
jgi:hypothetical protein